MIPDDPNTLLKRRPTAEALTEAGFPTKPATLATKATRGGGPPYRRFGAVALYRWGDALNWARSRLSPPRCSTSERDAALSPPTPRRGNRPRKEVSHVRRRLDRLIGKSNEGLPAERT
jgi:hypothetical protein